MVLGGNESNLDCRSVTTYLRKPEQPISNTHVLCMKTSVFLTIHLSFKKVQKDIRVGSEI